MTKQRTPPQLSCRCQLYSTASHRMAKTDAMAAGALRSPTATGAGRVCSAAHRPAQSPRARTPRSTPSIDRAKYNARGLPRPASLIRRRCPILQSTPLDVTSRSILTRSSARSVWVIDVASRTLIVGGSRPALVFSTGRR